jgi:hypothetical protein
MPSPSTIDPVFQTRRDPHLTIDLLRGGWGKAKSAFPSLQGVEDAIPSEWQAGAEGVTRALAPGEPWEVGASLLGPAAKYGGKAAAKGVGGLTALLAGTQEAEALPKSAGFTEEAAGAAKTARKATKKAIDVAKAPTQVEQALQSVTAAPPVSDLRADIMKAAGYDPAQVAVRYPEKLPGVETTDPKSGKTYLAKQQSPEALAVEKVRKAAQKDIDKGNYTPHFPVEERFHIQDTSRYPLPERTADVALPKKQATIDKFKQQFDTPEARARLEAAYDAKQGDPLSHNWYAMGQLEREFVNELGPEAGAKAFRENFSRPMAATTGGADPTGNLLMGAYGNYLRGNKLPQPQGAWDMPYPIGGRYASGNMEMYDKALNQGRGLSAADQPKRHNFAANFEGHTDRSTIDEQMMQAFDPKLAAPPGASYGVTEGVVNDLAAGRGVSPADYQGVVWTGLKDTQGKPMMQVVNEAIERTRRVTGKDPKDIVRDSFVRGTHPLYGVAGLGTSAALINALRNPEEKQGAQ